MLLSPFNRTSMESKPCENGVLDCSDSTFNRTSMESKLLIDQIRYVGSHGFNRASEDYAMVEFLEDAQRGREVEG